MRSRNRCVILTAIALLALPAAAVGQSSDVTFTMPVNLKQVSSDITRVAVYCEITSAAIIPTSDPGTSVKGLTSGSANKQEEYPLVNGLLSTTAQVAVPIPFLDTSLGRTANYTCSLSGFSQSLQRWSPFDAASTTPAFRLTPSPQPLSGTFNW